MAKTNSGLLEFKDAQKVLSALDDATSEVKKAVVIDGDGVETDIQGVQPTGKKEITSTAEVNVANYATAQVVDEDLVAGNIKKDVDILGVVGSYEAAASDFSTAEVTVNGTGAFFAEVASLKEGALYGSCFKSPLENSFTVVLYKGSTIMEEADGTPAFTIPESETNIVFDQDAGTYTITGNCTITLTPEH